ncbi:response regulator transcription factor [Epibacterium sp. Ofav1-8]|uniref:response regulator transcription factor n=1 Tax=Epibacterium sp. Ofav1-8 TaxID=2917735 RepID=UPI001EF48371|nr:response regulator transcription factor [Epibacterium sp. Ofav1-8]MCG7625897.1 response regulator transcription factor [Epibacterium sp. Ofav1-8]
MKILLVEDEQGLAESLRDVLQRERFITDHADRLEAAREAVRLVPYDLVLLDRTLPDGDGLSLIPLLRSSNAGIHVIVLSARNRIDDRIAGLDGGADDYLTKPFSIDEMLARIRAVRRRPIELLSEEIRAGSLVFDLLHEEVTVDGLRIDIPRRELRVLAALIKRRGRTVPREALENAVFGFDDEIQSNTLDSHISRLRRRLNSVQARIEIHAIRGVGYLLREAM